MLLLNIGIYPPICIKYNFEINENYLKKNRIDQMIKFFNKSKLTVTFLRMYSSNIATNEVIFNKVNHVGCITLNRPKQLNALN